MKAVYVKERHMATSQCATDIERSLFTTKKDISYHSQQPVFESMVSNVVYYSQVKSDIQSEDSFMSS